MTMLDPAEVAQLDRAGAILALAGGFRLQRADVETLERLSEVACPTADLASLIGMAIHNERLLARNRAARRELERRTIAVGPGVLAMAEGR